MLTPFVAGLFALAGVLLGVFLEPVRAKVAARARLREDRALRCTELVEAASTCREQVKWLLRTIRTDQQPLPATTETTAAAEQRYWQARGDLKKMVMLIRLVGPDQLITSAQAVIDTDRAVRGLWFGLEADERRYQSVKVFETLRASREALEEFAALARRVTTSR